MRGTSTWFRLRTLRYTGRPELLVVSTLYSLLFSAILSNTAAINASVSSLQTFQSFLNQLIQTNDKLLLSERFMLKIIRLKFELETCLKSLRCSLVRGTI